MNISFVGIPDFNFSINKSKVQTNFNVSEFTDGITVLQNTGISCGYLQ